MELFVKIVDSFQSSTIFTKRSILDLWQGSEYDLSSLTININLPGFVTVGNGCVVYTEGGHSFNASI